MLISQNTKRQIDLFLVNPSNSLVIESPVRGAGIEISYQLIRKLLKLPDDYVVENSQHFYKIEKDNNTVQIDSIRDLIKQFKLKSLNNKVINRIGLVNDAHLMSEESQNSILKLLEEPPSDTVIILLTRSLALLKSTILSRSAVIKITKPSYSEFIQFYSKNSENSDLKNKFDLTDGNSDFYIEYLNNEVDISKSEDIILIKKFLSSNKLDRLLMINDFCTNKIVFDNLLFTMKNMVKIGLDNSIIKHTNQYKFWISYLKAIETTETGSIHSVNRKLLFTNLCLNM
ncbi:MAG TPA: hypothetical protein VMV24_02700 [Candidatus Dormibacteraeota bacterium]|nr:hypothetical protein [Candidatus Dormibacteraeota bacterium]